jgi:MFS superfamily sulfate permease-like transporter
MRGKGFIIILVLLALVCIVFIRPLLTSEEARIRKGVTEGVEAMEAKDLEKCLRHVSLHYKDEYGLTYLSVKRLLTHIFREFDAFDIDLKNLSITLLDKEAASASFDLKVKVNYRGQKVYLLGSMRFPNHITMSFVKEGRRWKVTQAEGVEAQRIGQGMPKVVRRCPDNTV